MSPKLSVIIPVYNNEKYMLDTIQCVQNTSLAEMEILLVDDGSKDNSVLIAEQLQKTDNRIRIISKENGGVVSARNFGLENALGEFVCFMDQDDIVEPLMYEVLINKIEETNSDFGICSSGRYIDGEKEPLDLMEDKVYEKKAIVEELLLPIVFSEFTYALGDDVKNHENHIWVCIFRKDFLRQNKIKFRAYVDFEDDLLVKVEALSLANRVCTISEIGYFWRIHRKSESFANKYIDGIGAKQDDECKDLLRSLRNISEYCDLSIAKDVIYCKQYIKTVRMSTCKENRKSINTLRNYFDVNIYQRDFDTSIKALRYLSSNKIRWRVVFPLLKRKNTILSFGAEWLIKKMQTSAILCDIERWIKKL